MPQSIPIPWLEFGTPLPPPHTAWGLDDPIPGLLAAGGQLSVDSLKAAYAQGTFPWYSHDQPILWWAPDPRMVLPVQSFKLHRSLRKKIQAFRSSAHCEIRFDHAFEAVIAACAHKARDGQNGTWIMPEMMEAYIRLHHAGFAHSVETWIDGQLMGGLYCVALGHAIFGESMFAHASDTSKIALAALVSFCRHHGIAMIDCQQNTEHLAFMGGHEISRADFLNHIAKAQQDPAPIWKFDPVYWNELRPSAAFTV